MRTVTEGQEQEQEQRELRSYSRARAYEIPMLQETRNQAKGIGFIRELGTFTNKGISVTTTSLL